MTFSMAMWCAAFALHFLLLMAEVRVVWAFCVPKSVPPRAKWKTSALVSAVTVASAVVWTLGVGAFFPWPDVVMVAAAFVAARYLLGCSLQRAGAAAGALFALTWSLTCLLKLLVEALLSSALS